MRRHLREPLRRHLGPDHLSAILDGYQYTHRSADGTRSIVVHLDDTDWARPDRVPRKGHSRINGRYLAIEHGHLISIPDTDYVLRAGIEFRRNSANPISEMTRRMP